MARYNSVNSTGSVTQGSSIASPASGLLTTITTGSGTTNLPNPVLYAGSVQTFYNATVAAITLSTPSGNITGPATSGTSTLSLPAGAIITLVSDGTNYIAQDWLGGPAVHTSITASGTITANSAVTFNPSNANVSIQPSGTGTVTINPATAGAMDNVAIGATTKSTGAFTTLSANSAVTFNAGANAAVSITNNYTFSGSNYHLRLIGDTTNYGYISQNPAQGGLVVADGMRYYGAGPWTPDATSAESIQLLGGNIIFTSNSSLTSGVNFTPTERVRINTTGQLLVGATSTADAARKILASGADANAQKIDVANTTGLGSLIEVIAGGNTAYSISGWDYSGIIEATGGGGTSGLVLSAYNGPLIFQTNSRAERLRITSNGNIIAGGTNTNVASNDYAYMFDFEPSRNTYASTASNGDRSHALMVRTPVLDTTNVDAIVISESGGQATGRNSLSWWNEDYNAGAGYRKARMYTQVGSSYNSTAFYIDVADGSRVLQNRLSIDVNGTVTIAQTLQVNANLTANNTLTINSSSYLGVSGGSYMSFYTFAVYGGNQYMHFKTNLRNTTSQMYVIEARGYDYGSGFSIAGNWCGYMYSPNGVSNPISNSVSNWGNQAFCSNQYLSTDGYLVLVGNMAAYYCSCTFNSYSTAQGIFSMQITATNQITTSTGGF